MPPQTDLTEYTRRFMKRMDSGEERAGQAAMNALLEINSKLYYEILDTPSDCFYDDNKLRAFEQRVFGEGDYADHA